LQNQVTMNQIKRNVCRGMSEVGSVVRRNSTNVEGWRGIHNLDTSFLVGIEERKWLWNKSRERRRNRQCRPRTHTRMLLRKTLKRPQEKHQKARPAAKVLLANPPKERENPPQSDDVFGLP